MDWLNIIIGFSITSSVSADALWKEGNGDNGLFTIKSNLKSRADKQKIAEIHIIYAEYQLLDGAKYQRVLGIHVNCRR